MKRKQIDVQIAAAKQKVAEEITGNAEGFFGRGLASEGYAGGYRDALDDVILLLNGVVPSRRNYWEAAAAKGAKP
jgi:hypothetical protein